MNSGNSLSDFFSPRNYCYSNLDMASIFKDSVLKTALSKAHFFDEEFISKAANSSGIQSNQPQLIENYNSESVEFKIPISLKKRVSPMSNLTSNGENLIIQKSNEITSPTTNTISKSDRQTYFPSSLSLSPVSSLPLSATLRKDPIFLTSKISNLFNANTLGMSIKDDDISKSINKQPIHDIWTGDDELKENDFDPGICHTPLLLTPSIPIKETDSKNSFFLSVFNDVEPLNVDDNIYENLTFDPEYTQTIEEKWNKLSYYHEPSSFCKYCNDDDYMEVNCARKAKLTLPPLKKATFESPEIDNFNMMAEYPLDTGCDNGGDNDNEQYDDNQYNDTCAEEVQGDNESDNFSFSSSHDDDYNELKEKEINVESPQSEPETKRRNWFSFLRHVHRRHYVKELKSSCHVLEDILIDEQREIEEKHRKTEKDAEKELNETEKLELNMNVILKCSTPKEKSESPNTFSATKSSRPTGSIKNGKMLVKISSSLLPNKKKEKEISKHHKMRQIRDQFRRIFMCVRKGDVGETQLTEIHGVIINAGNKNRRDILSVKQTGSVNIMKQETEDQVVVLENQSLLDGLKKKGKVEDKPLRRQLIKCIKKGEICILEEYNGCKLVTIDIS